MVTDKKRRPVIGKLITPGLRSGFPEVGTSPTTPFEFKVLSPRGMIHCDMSGIGLGIVAALENIPAKNTTFDRRNPIGSDPVSVNQDEEEYTIVTRRKANESYTKVYHGGFVTNQGIEIRSPASIFDISPARFDDVKVAETSGFLSSCFLCNKRLHGKDIFMYRGEKAFCSPECRSRQIGMDEKREKYCSSEAESNKSPNNGCHSREMFATGIYVI
ncbi:hypothetical protein L6452_03948 [Arctium lappa]|uniref:Uncharacterized protein n=1 Tax=Arctium lappa TaxID=4217 RepID=A0ACB9FNN5_ARCLA|nr:hypothetical protein L6452_03948 [Arctium lappa]